MLRDSRQIPRTVSVRVQHLVDDYLNRLWKGAAEPQDEFVAAHPEDSDDLRFLLREQLQTNFFLPAPADPSLAGRKLGDFVLGDIIARGGMGVVYEAEQISLHRPVAVKVLAGPLSVSAETILKFRREAEAGGRLHHPGIVATYSFGQEDGVYYIAQELVPGGRTLAHEIADMHRVPSIPASYYREVAGVIAQVADALQAAHDVGVIHRDVKPGNILMTAEGRPRVSDFGLAKVDDAPHLSRTGRFEGTPFYVSPEQAAGKRNGVDHRTDVFSLGATLYEALTLHRPFDGDTARQVIEKILVEEPVDPRRLRSRLPRDLAVICMKALEKRRYRRYPSMRAFAADLRSFLNGQNILARPPGPWRFIRGIVRRYPTESVAALLLVGVVGFSFALKQTADAKDRERERRVAVEQELDEAQALSDLALLRGLEQMAEQLWPQRPAMIESYRNWLHQSRDLLARRERHRTALAELEASLGGLDEPARETQEGSASPAVEERILLLEDLQLRIQEAMTRTDLDAAGQAHLLRPLRQRERELRLEIEQLDTSRREPVGDWTRWVARQLGHLVEELEVFGDPRYGLIAEVERRLEEATTITARTIDAEAAAWDEARFFVAESVTYQRMELAPQVGLVPLGPDPLSGLWEFWHVESGARPERDSSSGQFVLTADTGIVLCLIPSGRFWMGAQRRHPEGRNYDPRAAVTDLPRQQEVAAFFLSKYEITQAQWQRLAGTRPSHYGVRHYQVGAAADLHPVEQVNCEEAAEILFCYELGLPGERQWEYAARAETGTPWWTGVESDSLWGRENLLGPINAAAQDTRDGYVRHAPVGRFAPNPFGLHDMLGNVSEWCRDAVEWVDAGGARVSPDVLFRVVRGGSHADAPAQARSAYRTALWPESRRDTTGIRPWRRITPPPPGEPVR